MKGRRPPLASWKSSLCWRRCFRRLSSFGPRRRRHFAFFYGVFDTPVLLFPVHKRSPDDARWSWQYQERVPVLLFNFFQFDEFVLSDTSGPPTARHKFNQSIANYWRVINFFKHFSAHSTLVKVSFSFSLIYCPTTPDGASWSLLLPPVWIPSLRVWRKLEGRGLSQVSYKLRREQKKNLMTVVEPSGLWSIICGSVVSSSKYSSGAARGVQSQASTLLPRRLLKQQRYTDVRCKCFATKPRQRSNSDRIRQVPLIFLEALIHRSQSAAVFFVFLSLLPPPPFLFFSTRRCGSLTKDGLRSSKAPEMHN